MAKMRSKIGEHRNEFEQLVAAFKTSPDNGNIIVCVCVWGGRTDSTTRCTLMDEGSGAYLCGEQTETHTNDGKCK